MKVGTLTALWLALVVPATLADAPDAVAPTLPEGIHIDAGEPAPALPALAVEPAIAYATLKQPFWTDDFIEQWVPSDVPRGHWSYEWLSWMSEEDLFRDIFPVEEYSHPDAPEVYADAARLARIPEVMDAVVRLTREGLVIGHPGGTFAPDAPARRIELGLVACRATLLIREAHARFVVVHPPASATAPRVNLAAPACRYELAEALARVMRCLGPLDARIEEALSQPPSSWELPPDVPRNHRFAPAVQVAVTMGLLKGQEGGAFAGDQPVRRMQVALAFTRLLDLLEAWPSDIGRSEQP